MASNSLKLWTEHKSALMDLVKFFEKAHGREGRITLPKHLLDAVKDNKPRELETIALIQAIEPAESAVCNRLDAEGLVVLCCAFLTAPSCSAQRRGFYLIMASLHHNQSDSPDKAAMKRSKKLLIGKHALDALIKSFTDLQTSEQKCRWVGILALELLEGCPDNARKLRSETARLRSLTGLFKRSNCRVLTSITGSIIRILLNNGINSNELSCTEDDRTLYSKFPRSKDHDMDWVLAFERFVDELDVANISNKQTSDVLYAFGLDVGEFQYNSVDHCAILVTVNRDLTIVVSASPTGPATYIDIPVKNIINTQIISIRNDESQSHRYAVTIELSQHDGDLWYHNAVGHSNSTISIAFTSESNAERLSELCRQLENTSLTAPAQVMESEPIDCSERGPATNSHEDTQLLANSVASAMEGIDVSQWDTTSCGKTYSKIQDVSIRTDGSTLEIPRRIGTSAEVPFEESSRQNKEDSSPQDHCSNSEDQGYDSSYDISPRPPRVQPKIRDDSIPVVQLDPSHSEESNRKLPGTEDGSTEMPPLSRLRRSPRNNNGIVESEAESAASLGLERAAGTPIEKITTTRPNVNHGVTASTPSKVKLHKSKLAKQANEGKDKAQALKVEDQRQVQDEYDLPRSPEPLVEKSKASMMEDKPTSQAPDRDAPPKQITKAKNVAKGPVRRSKEPKSKKAQPQPKDVASRASGVHKIKAKPIANPTKIRSRRAAAVIANEKIQGFGAFDEISDEVEKPVSKPRRQPATTADTPGIQQSLTGMPEDKISRSIDGGEASVSGDAKNGMVSRKAGGSSSGPYEDQISEASSMDKVDLVTITTGHGIVQAATASKSSPLAPNADPFQAKLSLLTPGNEATTSNANVSARSHTEPKSKASKGDADEQHQADEGETVGRADHANHGRRFIQPKTRGDVRNIQQEENGSLDRSSDLNKRRQLLPQPQQTITEPNGPSTPAPVGQNKRKAVHGGGARRTRRKAAQSSSSQSTSIANNGPPLAPAPALNQSVQGAQRATHQYRTIIPLQSPPRPPRWRIEGLERARNIPAHYLSPDGTLIDVHTEENIVPEERRDSFVSDGQAGTSDFMQALRRQGVNVRNDDPNATLVEEQSQTTQRADAAAISSSSITTFSSSEPASSGVIPTSVDPSSEEGNENIMAQWRTALQPHQRLMAGVLTDINQVLIHRLATHETAVEDLVERYRSGGNEILDRFMQERQAVLQWNESQIQQVRHQLSAVLESALAGALDTLNGVGDERHEFMERFNAHQGEVMDKAEEALSRFTEED